METHLLNKSLNVQQKTHVTLPQQWMWLDVSFIAQHLKSLSQSLPSEWFGILTSQNGLTHLWDRKN